MSKYYNIDDRNVFEYEYTRFKEWHEHGFRGQGIKVAIIDEYGEDASIPYHGNKVRDIFHMLLPDAKVRMFEFNEINKISGGYDIVSISAKGNTVILPAIKDLYDRGTFVVVGAGNDGDDGESLLAQQDWTFSIGAVYADYNDNLKIKSYSSHGLNVVDGMSFTDIYVPNGDKFTGTSCATPVGACKIALMIQYYKYINEFKRPTQSETMQLAIGMCEDFGDFGYDEYSGHGVLRLPEIDVDFKPYLEELTFLIDKDWMVANGKMIDIPTKPTINDDDYSVVPPRFVIEPMGGIADYKIVDGQIFVFIKY